MFFTGTNSTMIPLTSEAVTMGVSNVQNAVRTPPTLWQYPSKYPIIFFFVLFIFLLLFTHIRIQKETQSWVYHDFMFERFACL